MPDQTPKDYSWVTYLWVMTLAAWGGTVNYIRNVRAGHTRPFNLTELIGELVTSAFVGVLTFWLCEASGVNQLITAATVGISGHMGGRTMFIIERWLAGKFPKSIQQVISEKEDEHLG